MKFAALTIPQESAVAVASGKLVDGIVVKGGSGTTNTSEKKIISHVPTKSQLYNYGYILMDISRSGYGVSRSCGVITPLFGVVQVTVKFAAFTIPQVSAMAVVSGKPSDGILRTKEGGGGRKLM